MELLRQMKSNLMGILAKELHSSIIIQQHKNFGTLDDWYTARIDIMGPQPTLSDLEKAAEIFAALSTELKHVDYEDIKVALVKARELYNDSHWNASSISRRKKLQRRCRY